MKKGRIAGIAVLTLFTAIFLAACGGGGDSAPAVPLPVVVTGAATSTWHDNATINGTVNPSGLVTDVWFEYGTDNTLATNTATTIDNAGLGTVAVAATANLTGLDNNTTYYYRIAASNSAGTVKGTIQTITTPALDAGPAADAGPAQSVYMAGASGATLVTMDASGSSDPGGQTLTYAWTQTGLGGLSAVTLTGDTTATPTFSAPQIAYGAAKELVFEVTVTNEDGLTSTDNVVVTLNWGFFDDFSVDTTATYVPQTGTGTLAWNGTDNVATVTTANGVYKSFTQTAIDFNANASRSGEFSFDFMPTADFVDGGIVIALGDAATTRYFLSTTAGVVQKSVAGVVVATEAFPTTYDTSPGTPYTIKITYNDDDVTFEAFGTTVSLTAQDSVVPISYFTVNLTDQNGTFDNFKLRVAP